MMVLRFGCILIFAASTFAYSSENITDRVSLCKRGASDYNKCLKIALENILSDISKEGLSDGPLDPMDLPELPMNYGTAAAERMGVSVGVAQLHGLSNLEINAVRSNLKDNNKLRLEIDIYNSKLFLTGNYSSEIPAPIEPVMTNGNFTVTLSELKGTLIVKGHVVERDGVEYVSIDRASIKPQLADLHIEIRNDDDPFPELTSTIMNMVNQYWRLVYLETLPLIEEGLSGLIRAYVDELIGSIPFRELLPQ